jgi:predicted O-methyltransferase YrrM
VNASPSPARHRFARSHRTPRYVYQRTRQFLYERAHPDHPWLTPAAIRLLPRLLRPVDAGAEFGSGRSTLWFAARVGALTSVEHDQRWHEAVSARLAERGLSNVRYILAREDQPVERGGDSAYARTALAFPDASLDFALVDGHYRDYSAKFIMPKIRPGGMLIIDNVNWYLPCRSKSPNSRTAELGPAAGVWAEVWRELTTWRTIWTSSGVWDTAIFIKPAPLPEGRTPAALRSCVRRPRRAPPRYVLIACAGLAVASVLNGAAAVGIRSAGSSSPL